ncbi:endonuclease domain-containing protein [Micromonospora sp. NPDC047730]|uniref:endonuclease domain-containing protein n=1 Tax=Micromonospora sp. NPDC047730 TaxID=3364253 RepID=UPI003719BFEE
MSACARRKPPTSDYRIIGNGNPIIHADKAGKPGAHHNDCSCVTEAQDYRCAICGKHGSELRVRSRGRPRLDGTPNSEPCRLVVDHCPDSRRVRRLLCTECNVGLGAFQDSPEALMAAARYLLARDASLMPESSPAMEA